ncbi:MAG TPA: peptide chain release factor N(5)-glutamine methyltransferase [Roseiarcus sp.]|nr:peptide chain release factor N(5)-glutamine methyltransferase [Roseiarcus sp.]
MIEGGAFTASTTRAEAFRLLVETFRDLNFEEAAREARLTICAACGLSPATMIAAADERLGPAAPRLGEFAVRRAGGEPLSKIVGKREFWGLPLFMSRDVLDPRPETETVVQAAVALFADRRNEPIRLVDLGVGSGALLCALLVEFPAALGLGVERSENAAAVARANVEACGLAKRAEVRIGNWTDGVEGLFDLIVSNPPYIPSGDIAGLPREVRDHDPPLALDGGADGLEAFRAIIPASAALLSPDGRLIVEVGAAQARSVLAIAVVAGFRDVATWRDLAGVERVVAARSRRV